MGLSASKRVSGTLSDSADFNSACNSVYEECLDLTQHAFPGAQPYQLASASASDRLHQSLSSIPNLHLIQKWVPNPPDRSQVDKAYRAVTSRFNREGERETEANTLLGPVEFKDFAVELYVEAVVSNAGKAIMQRVPIGVAGIAGVGLATRSGKELIGTVIGVYALGVATSIYLNLAA